MKKKLWTIKHRTKRRLPKAIINGSGFVQVLVEDRQLSTGDRSYIKKNAREIIDMMLIHHAGARKKAIRLNGDDCGEYTKTAMKADRLITKICTRTKAFVVHVAILKIGDLVHTDCDNDLSSERYLWVK